MLGKNASQWGMTMHNKEKDDDNIVRDLPFGHHHGKCPKCGSRNVVPILYGYPTAESIHKAHRGELYLGGCIVTGDDPQLYCRECGKQW